MRRVFLFGICLATFSAIGLAGHRGAKVQPVDPPELDGAVVGEVRGVSPSVWAIGPGDSLGATVSDYGTNGSACHNLINYGDGTLSLGRMAALTSDATDRGTHYSYSADGGATWTPLTWIEGTRQGWGNIAQFPDAGGTEVTVAHSGMAACVDAAKGANVWSCGNNGSGGVWPRMATTSPFYVHVVTPDANPPTTIVYEQSADAGVTWSLANPIFTDPGFFPDADAQDIAAFGTNVAIVNAPNPDGVNDMDVLLAISTDNGATWTDQVLDDMPGPGDLPTGQEDYVSDTGVACVYDANGNLHVTWTVFLAIGDATNSPEQFYQIDAPIYYWSEATGTIEVPTGSITDTSIVKPGNLFGNLITQPDIGVDANGNPFILYMQQIGEQDTAGLYLQHIYAVASPDGGTTWNTPVDVTPGAGFNADYHSMADLVDEYVHFTYFSDPLGGNAVRGNHEVIPVAVMYHKVLASDILGTTGVNPVGGVLPDAYQLEQNYPNPFNPTTNIRYSIPNEAFVSLKVYDMIGQEVATLVDGHQSAGNYVANFDATSLANGTYFYTLKADGFSETKKMVLVK
ncbi:MAG: T9SS type A sorting domain-containing protein [Ignavibacteria bacterium]|nr:T9SS type A sorting domain-containing protein [Ignavibacteria bacterium]